MVCICIVANPMKSLHTHRREGGREGGRDGGRERRRKGERKEGGGKEGREYVTHPR